MTYQHDDTPALDTSFHDHEMDVDGGPTEQAWLRWIAAADERAGHSLDGDEAVDGYSLDGAYEAWEAGKTVEAYVASIRVAA